MQQQQKQQQPDRRGADTLTGATTASQHSPPLVVPTVYTAATAVSTWPDPAASTASQHQAQAAEAGSMGDDVAAAVLAQFAALPKTGKPQPHEHTVLAGIALSLPAAAGGGQQPAQQLTQPHGHCEPAAVPPAAAPGLEQAAASTGQQQAGPGVSQLAVVAIGTGTKCLGASKRRPGGVVVNDCHAEAVCRRALLRWLYAEMDEAIARFRRAAQAAAVEQGTAGSSGASAGANAAALAAAASTSVLRLVPPAACPARGADANTGPFGGWQFGLQPGVRLHMYVSQPPCGDASILGAHGCLTGGTGAAGGHACVGGSAAAADGYGRTGAKPLKRQRLGVADDDGYSAQPQPQQEQGQWRLPQQHEVESYGEGQATGILRRKPGRGDATLSMSCSDKLARWALLGLQASFRGAGLLGQAFGTQRGLCSWSEAPHARQLSSADG